MHHIYQKASTVLLKQPFLNTKYVPQRGVQISVVGAASNIGSNLSLLLKQNPKVTHLKLFDEDERVNGIGLELAHVPGGPSIGTYDGDKLGAAVEHSHIVVMVSRTPRKPGYTREQMMNSNAHPVQKLCRAIVSENPETFIAISTNPLNCMIPFASAMLHKYGCYNPFKILGITHIDTARTRAFTGNALQVNPRHINVPVIGGHSDDTIIPLFSNISPDYYQVDKCQADMLTRLVRKAGTEVLLHKQGTETATLAMAWSIHEFVDGLADAVNGKEVVLNCFTANPHYGTRFFAGPTTVGSHGIIETCSNLTMSDYEQHMLITATPALNRDVTIGEDYVKYVDTKI